jgi:hypothetical protein
MGSLAEKPEVSRIRQRRTVSEAGLAANRANAKLGCPKGKLGSEHLSLRDRCRVRDMEHIAILEEIAADSSNRGSRIAVNWNPRLLLPLSRPRVALFGLSLLCPFRRDTFNKGGQSFGR